MPVMMVPVMVSQGSAMAAVTMVPVMIVPVMVRAVAMVRPSETRVLSGPLAW